MIHLHYSNRTEALLDVLARGIEASRPSPFEPVLVVVPNRNMERYVELGLASRLGIAANLRFLRLERFVWQWLEDATPDLSVLDRAGLETRILSVLLDDAALADSDLDAVRRYLGVAGAPNGDDAGARAAREALEAEDAIDLRRIQLAQRLAALFEEYAFSRPEMLDAWARRELVLGATPFARSERWQRALFDRVVTGAVDASGRRVVPLNAALAAIPKRAPLPRHAAGEAHVFGVSYVARVFQRVFAELGSRIELHLYTLNPCMEFWEDLETEQDLRRRIAAPRRGDRVGADVLESSEDPFGLAAASGDDAPAHDDTPALRLWGRPGREHVRLLNELTDCDFRAAFADPARPAGATTLRRLQRDILFRAPERSAAEATSEDDGTIRVLSCPGVRREVEAVADEIWHLVREARAAGDPLRFNDIAVIVNGADRDTYMPHVQSVLHEAHSIPHNVVDVPLASGSRIVEAALLLLDLPLSRFGRPEVLDVLTHPAVRGPDVDPRAWIDLVDRLGIFHGIDRGDHEGTYVARDILSWDQGVRRLALGAFMTGERSGDRRAFELGGERYLPEEAHADEEPARLGLVVRSLLADARYARGERLSLGEWAQFFRGLFEGYLTPSSEAEESDLRRCLAAAQGLAERAEAAGLVDREGAPPLRVSYRIAAELVRSSLGELSGGRGEYLADGVVVSSFLPMRAIPFRVIFVLGLGEGRFPASERRDTMDLRGARRRAGDVTPAERDRYMFLEALLSARDRMYVSWVARDELTGDPIAPSPVVQELAHMLRRGYVRDASALVRRVPLRRHEAAAVAASDAPLGAIYARAPSIVEASREARARALGESLRGALAARALPRDAAEDMASVRRAAGASWDALQSALGIVAVPDDPARGADDEEIVRLSLSQLRRFLECPMQGWAKAVLGIEEDDLDAPESLADEPFAPGLLEASTVLRDAYVRGLRGESREDAYAEATERLEAQGRWPTGSLREVRAREDRQRFELWDAQMGRIASLAAAEGDDALPVRARFGGGLEHGDAHLLLDAIALDVDDPRPGRAGRTLRIELHGATEPIVRSPRGSLTLVPRPPAAKDASLERARFQLRAFLTHVALSASGALEPREHAAWVVYADGGSTAEHARLAALSRDASREWLASIAADLLAGPHAHFMPCEAVFLAAKDGLDAVTGEDLVAAVDTVRDEKGGGSSRFGPVPRALARPAPPPDLALAIARRRYGLFYRARGAS